MVSYLLFRSGVASTRDVPTGRTAFTLIFEKRLGRSSSSNRDVPTGLIAFTLMRPEKRLGTSSSLVSLVVPTGLIALTRMPYERLGRSSSSQRFRSGDRLGFTGLLLSLSGDALGARLGTGSSAKLSLLLDSGDEYGDVLGDVLGVVFLKPD